MGWRRVDLVHSLLSLAFITTFWSVVCAQSNTKGPCNTCPIECIGRQCVRYWWTSMWGFIVTIIALTMDVWGAMKVVMDEGTVENIGYTFLVGAFNPLFIVWVMLYKTINSMAMLTNLREALGNGVVASSYPWSKSHIKIISGCDVIVNLSPDVHKEVRHLNAFWDEVIAEGVSEALVIGHKVANSKQFDVQLTPHGALALLRSNVLPPYDELKILRGSSSWGVAIASMQAIGYIYGVVVRCVQGLRVSPLEAIACILNLVILMKGVLHNFASLGHRPLLLYLLPREEAKFIEECKNLEGFDFKTRSTFNLATSIASGVLLAVGIFFIVNFLKSLNRTCAIPIILFEVSLVLGGIPALALMNQYRFMYLFCPIGLLSLVSYVWALVVTFQYWKGEQFDVQASNYLSQVLPYIG